MLITVYEQKENKTHYYNLVSIAIDYSIAFKKDHLLKRGYNKVPINQTEMKTRIIERLLAMMKYIVLPQKKHKLDQNKVLELQ